MILPSSSDQAAHSVPQDLMQGLGAAQFHAALSALRDELRPGRSIALRRGAGPTAHAGRAQAQRGCPTASSWLAILLVASAQRQDEHYRQMMLSVAEAAA